MLFDFSDTLIDELSTDISNDEYIDLLKDMQSTLAEEKEGKEHSQVLKHLESYVDGQQKHID